MSDPVLAALVQHAISQVTDSEPGLVIATTRVTRGWGDIVFVRIHARSRGHRDPEEAEARLREAVDRTLAPERTSISVDWLG
jgi:hypothetical protein